VLYHDSDIYPGRRSVKRWLNKIGYELLCKLVFVKLADLDAHSDFNKTTRRNNILGIKLVAKEIIKTQQCFTIKDLAINGHDIIALGVKPSPKIGEILDYILAKVVDEEIENDHDILIEEAKRYLKGE
jgi:tRNA nucleotidyltransferase (CCA-adding enzyme)